MAATRSLLTLLALLCRTDSRCSPTTYYENCWIRRFPGLRVNVEASQRRGAQLLGLRRDETARQCSRSCCLGSMSCNLAVFHFDVTPEHVNCFHLHCPTLESCTLSRGGDVVLFNITRGVDPDLLVFGKHFESSVRVLPHHYSRGNASDTLPQDKRQLMHPPPPPAPPAAAEHTTTARMTATQFETVTAAAATSPLPSGGEVQTTTAPTAAASSHASTPAPFTADGGSGTISPCTMAQTPTLVPPSTSLGEPTETALTTTAGSPGAKHTTERGGGSGGVKEAELGSGFNMAAHAVLVAVAICAALLLSCCCSVLLVVGWRGKRKRKGRYRTSWRGKSGSMRLMKYALVREHS